MAALWSGICLTNAGLGAVHGLAAPLGANYPIPHGTICAALLPGVMLENVSLLARAGVSSALTRYADVGRALAAAPGATDDQAIDAAMSSVRSLKRDLKIERLGTFGLTSEACPRIAALAKRSSSIRYNPVELSEAALTRILAEAI